MGEDRETGDATATTVVVGAFGTGGSLPASFSESALALARQLAAEIPALRATRASVAGDLATVTDQLGRAVMEAVALIEGESYFDRATVCLEGRATYTVPEMCWKVGVFEDDHLAAWTAEARPVLLRESASSRVVLTDPREPWPPGAGALPIVGDGFRFAGATPSVAGAGEGPGAGQPEAAARPYLEHLVARFDIEASGVPLLLEILFGRLDEEGRCPCNCHEESKSEELPADCPCAWVEGRAIHAQRVQARRRFREQNQGDP